MFITFFFKWVKLKDTEPGPLLSCLFLTFLTLLLTTSRLSLFSFVSVCYQVVKCANLYSINKSGVQQQKKMTSMFFKNKLFINTCVNKIYRSTRYFQLSLL